MHAIFAVVTLAIIIGLGNTQDMPKPGVCGISKIKPKALSRVVNGEAAIPHSRPYQLLLVGFFPNGTAKHYCGASLVKTTHVLTAAHCVKGYAASDIYIFPGVHNFTPDLLNKAKGVAVRQIFIHESYAESGLNNDVAVLRLQLPLVVDNEKVGLICVAEKSTEACLPNNPVVASGWGSTTGDPNRPSSSRPLELQQVGLQCVANSQVDCKPLTYVLGIFEQKAKMCAYAPNKAVCFGDSGGPLVRERRLSDGTIYLEQVGIMSGTVDCSFTKPRPDVYANVRELSAWILNKIKGSL
jgi:secreted trypsin-like serine protease